MKIKELRTLTGLTQKEFAKKYSLGLRQVQTWEEGVHEPHKSVVAMLEKLIKAEYGDKK